MPRGRVMLTLLVLTTGGCTTVDPGPNFVVSDQIYNADYFYCHVEPELLVAKTCGSGAPGDNNNCHYNSSAVSGMALVDHAPINCGGGEHPLDPAQVGIGSAAQGNFQAASLEMSPDYQTAPIYVRPTGHNHPRQIFAQDDPVVNVIRTWAMK